MGREPGARQPPWAERARGGPRGGEGEREQGEEEDAPDDGGAGALLRAFEERHGEEGGIPSLLRKLNGTFALAYHDPTTRCLTLANDRYGLMPLYHCHDEEGGAFLFASEVKAILRVLGPRRLDWHSVADFFYVGHMMGQRTLFEGVRLLDSGQVVTYREGTLKEDSYHDFTRTPVLGPEEVSTEKLATLFLEAVRRRVRQDKPNTLLLSGGFDSRLILGALNELGVTPRIVTLEHGRQAGGMDGKLAVLMANRLGLECDFRRTRADFFSSPETLETFYIQDGMVPTWGLRGGGLFISEVYPELEGGMGALWDGLGIDDALGGAHLEFEVQQTLEKFAERRGVNRLLLALILTPRWFLAANGGFMSRLRGELDQIPPSENQFRLFGIKHRTRRRTAVRPYQLSSAKVDPVTPVADSDFADYAHNIPLSFKTNDRLYIEMLRKHFPILTEVPAFSGDSLFRFDGDEWKRGHVPQTPGPRERQRKLLKRISGLASKALGAMGAQRHRTHTDEYETATLVIRVLGHKNFERPFYNKRLLRRLFSAYRGGNGAYHHLFTLVFYIELWHLLFVDQGSPVLFAPRQILPAEKETEHRR